MTLLVVVLIYYLSFTNMHKFHSMKICHYALTYIICLLLTFAAVYLSLTLVIGALSVMLSVFVLSLYHRDQSVLPSSGLQTLVGFLDNILYHGSQENNVSISPMKKVPTKMTLEDFNADEITKNNGTYYEGRTGLKTEHSKRKQMYTWRETAFVFDKFFLVLFLALSTSFAVVFNAIIFG